jgi:DNA (cytosine-5)-methyltransferase 1
MQAGYDLVGALEMDQWACDTLRENHPDLTVVQGDIREFLTSSSMSEAFTAPPDVIIGGPPCQGFSHAGPSQKDPSDPRNSLFLDFARWVGELQPQVFLMENVKGLLRRKNASGESVRTIIETTFREIGYSTDVWVLNAASYGVPQLRERVFFVGHRDGSQLLPPPATHSTTRRTPSDQLAMLDAETALLQAPTLWDAISDLPERCAGGGEEVDAYGTTPQTSYQQMLRGQHDVLFNHVAMRHSKRLVDRFKHIGWGQSGADVPDAHLPHRRNGKGITSKAAYDQNNRRLHPDKPSHTIAASFYANFVHPYQHRNITAREGARIQSFPDHYRFMGRKTVVSHKLLAREGRLAEKHLCQYNQIGNAVPPLLAASIAHHLASVAPGLARENRRASA